MLTPLTKSGIIYLPSFPIIFLTFETINFPITVTGWPNFAASLWTLCQSDLSFSTYEPSHKIPDQTHKLPSIQ